MEQFTFFDWLDLSQTPCIIKTLVWCDLRQLLARALQSDALIGGQSVITRGKIKQNALGALESVETTFAKGYLPKGAAAKNASKRKML